MTRRWRPLLRALTALAVVTAGVVGASGQPAAADPGACTPSVGVVVVVDFRSFGGGIQRGCDSTPTTGFEAIHSAGFATVGTQHDGPGFICRINGLPAAATDPCIVTPPATRYWSYWHSDPGQSGWSYSQVGATSYRPKAGSVDAWVYGATDTSGSSGGPTFSPSSVRATAPAPPPPTTTSGGGAGGGTGGGGGATGGGGSGGSGGSGGQTPATPAPKAGAATPKSTPTTGGQGIVPTAAPTASAATDAAPTGVTDTATSTSGTTSTTAPNPSVASSASDPPVSDVRAAPTAAETPTGSPWPAVAAVVLVLGLGAAAGVVALRRRRATD